MIDRGYNNLFVITYGTVGDFIMLLYFLERVHTRLPHCRFFVLATRNAPLLRAMAVRYPHIIIIPVTVPRMGLLFAKTFAQKNLFVVPPTFHAVPRFVKMLAALLCFPRGKTAGFSWSRSPEQYDIAVSFDPKKLFYQNLNTFLEALGLQAGNFAPPRLPEDASVLKPLHGGAYIAVAPFAASASRSLPKERWAKLLAAMPLPVVLLGGPNDRADAEALAHLSGAQNIRVACGVPFAQTVSYIKEAALFVGVDSGLTHVAGALGAPSVVVGNLSNPTWLPRYNPNAVVLTESKNCLCTGEKTKDCFYEINGVRYFRCMLDVTDERIIEAVRAALKP